MNHSNSFRSPLSWGLALGGGGARGLAHVGVLKALENAGLTPGYLACSSMGGLLAALWAAGWSAAQIETEVLDVVRLPQIVRLLDVSRLRRGGLLEGQRVRAYISSLIGADTTFAHLRMPLALTAVDLVTGQEVVLTEGSVVEAVLATFAFPSLFPPVEIGAYQLIDGGVLNNVPVDVVRAMGADLTVAVDVSPELSQAGSADPEESDLPSLIPGFARSFYLAELIMVAALTRARLEATRPDLIVRPTMPPGIAILWGFGRAAEAIAAGLLAGQEALPALAAALHRANPAWPGNRSPA